MDKDEKFAIRFCAHLILMIILGAIARFGFYIGEIRLIAGKGNCIVPFAIGIICLALASLALLWFIHFLKKNL